MGGKGGELLEAQGGGWWWVKIKAPIRRKTFSITKENRWKDDSVQF